MVRVKSKWIIGIIMMYLQKIILPKNRRKPKLWTYFSLLKEYLSDYQLEHFRLELLNLGNIFLVEYFSDLFLCIFHYYIVYIFKFHFSVSMFSKFEDRWVKLNMSFLSVGQCQMLPRIGSQKVADWWVFFR